MLRILKHFRHRMPLSIRFSDLDAAGHVNNSRYQTFIEEARIAYSQDVFKREPHRFDFNAVVSRVTLEYIKPIEFGDEVHVYTRFSNFTANSHEVHNLFIRQKKDKQEIVCKAHTLMAAFDYASKQPATFSTEYKTLSENYENAQEPS
jgi:acyl-CoA thioester hydrolase